MALRGRSLPRQRPAGGGLTHQAIRRSGQRRRHLAGDSADPRPDGSRSAEGGARGPVTHHGPAGGAGVEYWRSSPMKRLRYGLLAVILGAWASAAAPAAQEPVPLHAYLSASCIIADEPFYAPDSDASKPGAPRAKFLPLLGLVVGKLAEVFITREMESSASQIKVRAARKDTLYTVISPLNLYLADGSAPPRLKLNPHLGCLTIVAAKLSPQGTDCTQAYLPKQVPTAAKPAPAASAPAASAPAAGESGSVENSLRRANICVQGSAAAVYEARIELSEDATAFRLHSTGYQINSLLSSTQ